MSESAQPPPLDPHAGLLCLSHRRLSLGSLSSQQLGIYFFGLFFKAARTGDGPRPLRASSPALDLTQPEET